MFSGKVSHQFNNHQILTGFC